MRYRYRHELEARVLDTELHGRTRRKVMSLPQGIRHVTVLPPPEGSAGLSLTVPVQVPLGLIPGTTLQDTVSFPMLQLRAERWSARQWVPVQRYAAEDTEYGFYLPLDGYAMVPAGVRVTVDETAMEKQLAEARRELSFVNAELNSLKRALRTVRQASS